MGYWMTLKIAARALAKNKMRAGLTVLGIVIGVAAVIATVSIGESASTLVQKQFEALGTNVFFVFPGSPQDRGPTQRNSVITLTADDATALMTECPSVLAAAPIVGAQGQVVYGNVNWQPQEIQGTDENFLIVRNWALARGTCFGEAEVRAAAKVCVIGDTLRRKLFQGEDPLGKSIRIKNVPIQVIGVLDAKGANMFGQDQDNVVLLPYTTVQKKLSGSQFNNINLIMASARSAAVSNDADYEIKALLQERHKIRPGQPDDFEVGNTAEFAKVLGIITGVMTALLGSIAAVSLLVGGVGIMNIMLVSVTERTREIGIRLAIGATGGDILRQFLIEAVLLSLIGGVVGILLGIGGSFAATEVINNMTAGQKWPYVVSPSAILMAMVVSSAVGIFFGYYPARKASRLDPIESLRYE
jgi:putative ABC transport system permease protein